MLYDNGVVCSIWVILYLMCMVLLGLTTDEALIDTPDDDPLILQTDQDMDQVA